MDNYHDARMLFRDFTDCVERFVREDRVLEKAREMNVQMKNYMVLFRNAHLVLIREIVSWISIWRPPWDVVVRDMWSGKSSV